MEQAYFQNIEQIREDEYPQLRNTTYLDHAGTTLYARSLNENFSKEMGSNLFGNPHSASPASALSTKQVDTVRSQVLQFFKADPKYFDVIFVANATAAVKLVMNGFRDYSNTKLSGEKGGFWYGYHYDAHNSLIGIRQVANGGTRCFRSDADVEGWLENQTDPEDESWGRPTDSKLGLFAYPAQSNLNGHRPPLDWPGRIRTSPHAIHNEVYTLLDAAAYVTTAHLNLSNVRTSPDFVALSFYKIFGFPDLGALIVRKTAGHILQQTQYFGGGTVEMVIAIGDTWHAKKTHTLHDELEDGTLPFHSIVALGLAMDVHERLYWTMPQISAHACFLSKIIYTELSYLRHGNGIPVCEIYKHPDSVYGDSKNQGPTIAFNIRNSQGGWVGSSDVEKLAIVRGIQLRTGGVCNPGGVATYLDLKPWELRRNYAEGMRCGNDFDILWGKPTGVVRVSLGAMSSMKDVETLIRFIWEVFVDSNPKVINAPSLRKDSRTTLRVENITLFPIQGCKGCQLPASLPADIKQYGLALDGEWCIYDLSKQKQLDVENYPQLQRLQPTLYPMEGRLCLEMTGTEDTNATAREFTLSIWERPSRNADGSIPSVTSVPDIYDSDPLAHFLSSIANVQCTLARYPYTEAPNLLHQKLLTGAAKTIQEQVLARKLSGRYLNPNPNPLLNKSLTVSTSLSGSAGANISIAGMDFSPSSNRIQGTWAYIRIGPYYFTNLEPTSTAEIRRVRHLPNKLDHSLAGQHTSLSTGQHIKTFTVKTASADAGLRDCISSLSRAAHVCPAAACARDFRSRVELDAHFAAHGEALPVGLGVGLDDDDADGQRSVESLRLEYEWKRRQHAAGALGRGGAQPLVRRAVAVSAAGGWRKRMGLGTKADLYI